MHFTHIALQHAPSAHALLCGAVVILAGTQVSMCMTAAVEGWKWHGEDAEEAFVVQVTLQYMASLNRRRPTIAILPSGGSLLMPITQ